MCNPTENPTDYTAKIRAAEKQAAQGCGLSDVLYESRVQGAYAAILNNAPEADRPALEAVLIERGYEPDFEPFTPGPGECSLTGIDVNCCPCGNHP